MAAGRASPAVVAALASGQAAELRAFEIAAEVETLVEATRASIAKSRALLDQTEAGITKSRALLDQTEAPDQTELPSQAAAA